MSASPRIPAMASFKSRLRSFGDSWPHGSIHYATPTLLAMSGFFHSPGGQHKDRCICYHCGVALVGWEEDDEPSVEHRVHSPNCPVIDGEGIDKLSNSKLAKKSDKDKADRSSENKSSKKRQRTTTIIPYFDRLRQKRRLKHMAGKKNKKKHTKEQPEISPEEPALPSEFKAFAGVFLRKVLLASLDTNPLEHKLKVGAQDDGTQIKRDEELATTYDENAHIPTSSIYELKKPKKSKQTELQNNASNSHSHSAHSQSHSQSHSHSHSQSLSNGGPGSGSGSASSVGATAAAAGTSSASILDSSHTHTTSGTTQYTAEPSTVNGVGESISASGRREPANSGSSGGKIAEMGRICLNLTDKIR